MESGILNHHKPSIFGFGPFIAFFANEVSLTAQGHRSNWGGRQNFPPGEPGSFRNWLSNYGVSPVNNRINHLSTGLGFLLSTQMMAIRGYYIYLFFQLCRDMGTKALDVFVLAHTWIKPLFADDGSLTKSWDIWAQQLTTSAMVNSRALWSAVEPQQRVEHCGTFWYPLNFPFPCGVFTQCGQVEVYASIRSKSCVNWGIEKKTKRVVVASKVLSLEAVSQVVNLQICLV